MPVATDHQVYRGIGPNIMPADKNSYFDLIENRTLKVLFMLLFSAVIFGLLYIFRYYFWPFMFAVIIYLALNPVNELLVKYVRKRGISSTIVIIMIFGLILVPLFYLLVMLGDQAYQLYKYIQQQINTGIIERTVSCDAVRSVIMFFNIEEAEIVNRIVDFFQKTSGKILGGVTAVVSYPISFSINFIFMLLMLFFLFKDGHRLENAFYQVLPFPEDIEKGVIDRLKEVIKVLLAGNLLIMFLQGFMVGLGMSIAGFSTPLLWGSIGAILSLIPVIGTTIIWIPASIYLVISGSYWAALLIGLWCLFWYFMLENLLKPVVFGEKLKFHPLLLFFLLLGSIQAFGLPGVLIGPILLTLFYSLWEIYRIMMEHMGRAGD